ncbi:MAG: type II toxin-antitoxin system HicB family antitoxin [Dehalococcoidia bacterium]
MQYTVVLLHGGDPGYTVLVPQLPGCITEGDSIDEALANAREAIALHIEGMAADGESIPQELAPPIVRQVEVHPNLPEVSTVSS